MSAAVLAALARLPDLGSARLRALLEAFEPEAAWDALWSGDAAAVGAATEVSVALARQWCALVRRVDLARSGARLQREGIGAAHLGEEAFPAVLAADRESTPLLFFRGDRALLGAPSVAIVGTRRATHYGREVAAELGAGLARAGVPVVSGLAVGVDGFAHEAVVAHGGRPVGVVGSGLDVVYPRRHVRLWHDVGERGLLLSEFPPGAQPEPWRFPVRNRTIARLAKVLVVVESHTSGGSLITAGLARDDPAGTTKVLVVPGSIRSPASAGTNALLRDGAAPCCDVKDVLMALSLAEVGGAVSLETRPAPSAVGDLVLRALGWDAVTVERAVERCALAPPTVVLELTRLERDGWVVRDGGRWHRLAQAPGAL